MDAANVALPMLPVRVGLELTQLFQIPDTNVAEGLTPGQQRYTFVSYICFKYCGLVQKESIPSHLPSDV